MHALLIAAHGSRRKQSNVEVEELTRRIAEQAGGTYQHYATAFLEIAEPSIEQGIRHCAAAGANNITIVPYFLAAGRHVADDIPEILEKMRAELPDVEMHLAPHIGLSRMMVDLVLASADEA